MKKPDQRIMLTKRLLLDALLEMLDHKPLSEICAGRPTSTGPPFTGTIPFPGMYWRRPQRL